MNIKRMLVVLWVALLSLSSLDGVSAAKRQVRKRAPAVRGVLKITSKAVGATVFLDGKQVGVVPMKSMRLKPGSYRLKVRKLGHLEYNNTIRIRPRKVTSLTIDMLPVASIVDGQSNVKGARLYVNGVEKGTLPRQIELKTGTYQVEVRASGYIPFKQKLHIVELGRTYPIKAFLAVDKLAAALPTPGKASSDDPLALEPIPELPLEPPPTDKPKGKDKGKSVPDDPLALEPIPELPLEPPPADDKPKGKTGDVLDDPLALEPIPELPLEVPPMPPKTNGQGSRTIVATPVDGKTPGGAFTPPNEDAGITKTMHVKKKFYKKWWFWTATAAAVVLVTSVSIGVAASRGDNSGYCLPGSHCYPDYIFHKF